MNSRHIHPLIAAVIALGFVAFTALIDAQQSDDLLEAVARGDLGTLQRALATGVEADVRGPTGGTPLIAAAMFGKTDLVRVLIEHKATLDVQNDDGLTPLHVATLFSNPRSVTLLLASGSARDLRNKDGQTPLDLVSGPWRAEWGGPLPVPGLALPDGPGYRSEQDGSPGRACHPSSGGLASDPYPQEFRVSRRHAARAWALASKLVDDDLDVAFDSGPVRRGVADV